MMFRNNILIAVLAASTVLIPTPTVHAGDGTVCLVTDQCDPEEPQLADCTNNDGSSRQTFSACCPTGVLSGVTFTCQLFGAPTTAPEIPAATATDSTATAAAIPAADTADTGPVATANSGLCNASDNPLGNRCEEYGPESSSASYTCNQDSSLPSGGTPYACCPTDQGLGDTVIINDQTNGDALNSCIKTPTADLAVPTNAPTPVSPDPTPGPTNGPTNDPTPGPTNDPTPDPTPGPTDNPTPYPTPYPTPDPTPGPTEPPNEDGSTNLADAPEYGDAESASGSAITGSNTIAAAAVTIAAAATAALF